MVHNGTSIDTVLKYCGRPFRVETTNREAQKESEQNQRHNSTQYRHEMNCWRKTPTEPIRTREQHGNQA